MYETNGEVRAHYAAYSAWLKDKPLDFIKQKQREADTLFARLGITFAVYGDESGVERSIPFDIVPRIMRKRAWQKISDGACQRVRALNAFLHDIYHDQEIIKAGIIPEQQILGNKLYRPEMRGFDVPGRVYVHIAGIDDEVAHQWPPIADVRRMPLKVRVRKAGWSVSRSLAENLRSMAFCTKPQRVVRNRYKSATPLKYSTGLKLLE